MIDFLTVALMLFWFTLPASVSVADMLLKTRIHPAALYFAATVVGCFLACVILGLSSYTMSAELDRFDLDGSGAVSDDEMTAEAQAAFDDFNRGGGGMESALACILTGMWYTFAFLAIWIPVLLIRQHGKHSDNAATRIPDNT